MTLLIALSERYLAGLTAATAQKKCPKASLINVNTLPRNSMHKSGVVSESGKNQHKYFVLGKNIKAHSFLKLCFARSLLATI